MQSKKHDDLRQRQRLKEELKDESGGSNQSSTPPQSEGLSGEGAESVLAHIRHLEQKRSDNLD